jgi:hypothetical protein
MKKLIVLTGLAVALIMAASPVMAASTGQFTEIQGQVTVTGAGGQRTRASLGTVVRQGDKVVTSRGAKATVLFRDGSVIRLGPSSTVTIEQLSYDEDRSIAQSAYNLAAGTMMSIVGSLFGSDESDYKVTTPTATSGVRGTMFIMKVGTHPQLGYSTTMAVGLDGKFTFQGGRGGGQNIGPGMYSLTDSNGFAIDPSLMSDRDLQDLLDSVTVGGRSLRERSFEIRMRAAGSSAPGALVPFEIVLLPDGDGDDGNPDDLLGNDNPSDFIYQEPPQAVELIITVNIP